MRPVADGTRKGMRAFASVSPAGQEFIVWPDAEWNEDGLLTALREVWHPRG